MDKLKEFEKKWPARSVGQINRYEAKHFLMDALADYKAELEMKIKTLRVKPRKGKLLGVSLIDYSSQWKNETLDAVLAILKEENND